MAAIKIQDFIDIQNYVLEKIKVPSSDTTTLDRIKRDINAVYVNEVAPYAQWHWLRKTIDLVHEKYYEVGGTDTASVTNGSTTVTLSSAIPVGDGSKAGHFIAFNGEPAVYKISAHTAGSDTLTLQTIFVGTTSTTAGFKIWTNEIALPTDCRETVEIRHDFSARPMIPRGPQKLIEISQAEFQREDFPRYYSTDDFKDPSTGDAESESDRYRIFKVYPARFDKDVILHVDYLQEVDALDADGDEPFMPIEDRIVIAYGALRDAWIRERNNEMASIYETKFQEKLGKMAARLEDGADMPRIEVDDRYMRLGREPLRKRFRAD